jgi:hypothetical protein
MCVDWDKTGTRRSSRAGASGWRATDELRESLVSTAMTKRERPEARMAGACQ